MFTRALILAIVVLATPAAFAQEHFEWQYIYGHIGGDFDQPNGIALCPDGDVVVTGMGLRTSDQYSYDIITFKLYPNGDTAWVRIYDSDSLDQAHGVAVDASGNIYVVGYTDGFAEISRQPILIKYLPNGDTDWIRYGPPGDELVISNAYAVALDGWGGVYTTGSGWDPVGGYDIFTTKWDTTGLYHWQQHYDYDGISATGSDIGWAITTDNSGYVYVAGTGKASTVVNSFDIIVIKYDTSGSEIWATPYSGAGELKDAVADIAIDDLGNVYVAGYVTVSGQWENFALLKFTSAGVLDWDVVLDGGWNSVAEPASDVEIDGNGDIVVGGHLVTTGWHDFYIAKYSSDGTLLWDRVDFTNPSSSDQIGGLFIDKHNDIYAVGSSNNTSVTQDRDFATVKYHSSGAMLWEGYRDGPGHGVDFGAMVLVNDSGNVVVAGTMAMDATSLPDRDIGVIMYSHPGCCYVRGDINHNGTGPDIADLVYLVNYMFNGGPQPWCLEETDVNGDATGPDIADLVHLVNYMFNGGPPPVPCP